MLVLLLQVLKDELRCEERRGASALGEIRFVHENFIQFVLIDALLASFGQPLSIREMAHAEIGYFDVVTVLRPEEVGRLDISMNDTLVMYFFWIQRWESRDVRRITHNILAPKWHLAEFCESVRSLE